MYICILNDLEGKHEPIKKLLHRCNIYYWTDFKTTKWAKFFLYIKLSLVFYFPYILELKWFISLGQILKKCVPASDDNENTKIEIFKWHRRYVHFYRSFMKWTYTEVSFTSISLGQRRSCNKKLLLSLFSSDCTMHSHKYYWQFVRDLAYFLNVQLPVSNSINIIFLNPNRHSHIINSATHTHTHTKALSIAKHMQVLCFKYTYEPYNVCTLHTIDVLIKFVREKKWNFSMETEPLLL